MEAATTTLNTLYSFTDGVDGASPDGTLIADANGDLFGTTAGDGGATNGTVFEIVKGPSGYASTPITLYSFTGGTDGAAPAGSLVMDSSGNLFGTTNAGGGPSFAGTVFEIANSASGYASTVTTLYSFTRGTDGGYPSGALAIDGMGDLFGTTSSSSAVFEIANTPSGYASTSITLADFSGPTDGSGPDGGVIIHGNGDLFGTTSGGGTDGSGTVFEIVNGPSGYGSLTTLYNFTGGPDGSTPYAGLVADANGNLFGTTYSGGQNSVGTVFELVNSASGYASTPVTLYSFANTPDGYYPSSGVILDGNGDLLGTTTNGGADGGGTVFEIFNTASGYASTDTILYSFTNGADGGGPVMGLTLVNGTLIGTTSRGGDGGYGTVFETAPSSFKTVYSFTDGADGAYPQGALIADAKGDLFGTTSGDGGRTNGNVFEIVNGPSGNASTPITLYSFTGGTDGGVPLGPLLMDASGNLFGTTNDGGGPSGAGTVFEIVNGPSGYASAPTTLYDFTRGTDGGYPTGTLAIDAAGDLFGAASSGSAVFEIANTPSGYASTSITLTDFSGPTDGATPNGGVIIDANGNLFGTTVNGGSGQSGTVFEIVNGPSGYTGLTTLYNFSGGVDGSQPLAGLVEDANGDLFGTTSYGGEYGSGVVFELVNTGTGYASAPVTILSFQGAPGGANPDGGVILDANGDLFGTTVNGGTNGSGTVFEIANTASGYASTAATLFDFSNGPDGGRPETALSLVGGEIVGTTYSGGVDGWGTVFEIAACYCPGTLILTDHGEIAVEALAIGDNVVTQAGLARPIRWIGRRSYAGAFIAGQHLTLPVCIKRGAIAAAVPHQDLWVSPGHAMMIDGQLIPAWRLINGVSVTQAVSVDEVTYYHVELNGHDVLMANGAAAESFLDEDCRGQFQNAGAFDALYPDAVAMIPLAKRMEDGFGLLNIQERMAARAVIAPVLEPAGALLGFLDLAQTDHVRGWAQDEDSPEEPVALEILIGGAPILCVLANGFRADLRAAGLGSGCHAFDALLPAGLGGDVVVRRVVDGAPLPQTLDSLAPGGRQAA
jgi:hypothetical protein